MKNRPKVRPCEGKKSERVFLRINNLPREGIFTDIREAFLRPMQITLLLFRIKTRIQTLHG